MTSTSPNATRTRLYADVLAHPDDDAPRFAYAAWLEQIGDPQGEYIRLSLAMAAGRISADELTRWKTLSRQYSSIWSAEVSRYVDGAYFDRGFVAHVRVDGRRFVQGAAQLFQLAPIQHADLTNAKSVFDQLCASPFLGRLRSLDVKSNELDDNDMRRFAGSPHVGEMRWLNLVLNRIDVPGLEALAASTTLRSLLFVGLGGNIAADPVDHDSVDWDGSRYANPHPSIQVILEQKYGHKPWLHPATDAPDRYRL